MSIICFFLSKFALTKSLKCAVSAFYKESQGTMSLMEVDQSTVDRLDKGNLLSDPNVVTKYREAADIANGMVLTAVHNYHLPHTKLSHLHSLFRGHETAVASMSNWCPNPRLM